eukprot:gnl/MRDRNA2_/MRDRNA2_190673_c0_seq1.p1 gnl/MRDRNA2_/MRDRNA2_190673_c0~~gnl/MRDRNA2_/MRDRNA2_190673_c0_seq1.p1  ORF type:complete len:287 (+),score=46.79 gnl/MRDRNA2_/MRDRNA2_190673_c0_seq1:91-951(+)
MSGVCLMELSANFSVIPDGVVEAIIEFLPNSALAASLIPLCRRCFCVGICHPVAFRGPVQAWRISATQVLDEQLGRLKDPPVEEEASDLRVGLEHADEELKLTEMSASFPSGTTIVLLKHARKVSGMLSWLSMTSTWSSTSNAQQYALPRQQFFDREVAEIRLRVNLLASTAKELSGRLPDPELPLRWAEWLETTGELVGLPTEHCSRYKQQRNQVAQVWANNRRTFLSTSEHIEAIAETLDELIHDAPSIREKNSKALIEQIHCHCGTGLRKAFQTLKRIVIGSV